MEMEFWIFLLVGLSLTTALPYKEQAQNLNSDPEPRQEIDQKRHKRELNDNGVNQLDFRFREGVFEEQITPDSIPKDDYSNNEFGIAYAMNNKRIDDQILEDNQPIRIKIKEISSEVTELTSDEDEANADSESLGEMFDKQTKSTQIEYIGSMFNSNIYKSENGKYFGADKEHILPLNQPLEIIYVSPRITAARRYTEKITKGASDKKDLVLKYSASHVPIENSNDVNTENTGQYNAGTTSSPMLEKSDHLSNHIVHDLLNGRYRDNYDTFRNSNNRLAIYNRVPVEKSHLNISTPKAIVDTFPNNLENVFKSNVDLYNGSHVRGIDGYNPLTGASESHLIAPPEIMQVEVPISKVQIKNYDDEIFRRNKKEFNRYKDDDAAAISNQKYSI